MEVGDEDVDFGCIAMSVSEANHWKKGAKKITEGKLAVDAKAGEDGGGFLRGGCCVHGYIITLFLLYVVFDPRPLYIFNEEGLEGAVDVGDEVNWVEEDGAEADGRLEVEFFALDHFDGDEHEDEIDESEGCESGEEGKAGLAIGAKFDEATEEHDDDADEHQDDGFHANDFVAEVAEVAG